ncbi:MAG TPA: hypothetical protein PKY31_05055 [Spirochaetota bacterium]|nr:hypothetical protein [Spirochaetota bacterium]
MKKILFVMMALVFAGLVACSSESSNKPSNDTASVIFENVFNEADEAFLAATGGGGAPSGSMMSMSPSGPSYSEGETPITPWENDDGTITVTGSYILLSESEYRYTVTITFTNHVCEDGTIINGSVNDVYNGTDETFSAHFTGDLDVTHQGTVYDFSWDFSFGFNGTDYTFTGGFTINGEYYPAYLEE